MYYHLLKIVNNMNIINILNPRPERFSQWQEDRGIMQEYGTWIMTESNCPSLKLDIEFPYEEVLKEVTPQYHQFVKHRGQQHPGWSSMCIHGQGVQYTDPLKNILVLKPTFTGLN